MKRRAFTLAALSLPLFSAASVDAKAPPLREALKRIHRDARDHAQRLDRVSALFLGKKYQLNPLGEGPDGDRDTDPVVDFANFDCVTYVEEVIALAARADLDEAIAHLQSVRYRGGVIDYGKRHHITMAQWLPRNIAAGFIEDVTASVAKKHVATARLTLAREHFRSAEGRALNLREDEWPLGTHHVPVLSSSILTKHRSAIPHGCVITTIRRARPNVPYRASHQGMVIVRAKKRFVRHAHQPKGRVIEDSLSDFLRGAKRQKAWGLTGFNLARVRDA